jgi:protein-L-isoaspartate(D-aspartate) O-methyltransferase
MTAILVFLYVECVMADDLTYEEKELTVRRLRMVDEQIARRGVSDPSVLAAMRSVPRHMFIPADQIEDAYTDGPLPIGHEQTISQPYVVASMTEHLALNPNSRVLEIGAGSGYQSAVLAEIVREVFTIEIIPELCENLNRLFSRLGYRNIKTKLGDGSLGWQEHAPYDGIVVTAAAPHIPESLTDQLAPSGRLIIPLATESPYLQKLYLIQKTPKGIEKKYLYGVRFVPMRGLVEK